LEGPGKGLSPEDGRKPLLPSLEGGKGRVMVLLEDAALYSSKGEE